MNLKQKERSALLAGRFPEIVREEPMRLGEEIILKTRRDHGETIPEFSLLISGRHKTKNGSWKAVYVVRDDRELYLNQGLDYTRSPSRALDREAPVLDPATMERYAKENEVKTRLLRAESTGSGKLALEYAIREQKRAWKEEAA